MSTKEENREIYYKCLLKKKTYYISLFKLNIDKYNRSILSIKVKKRKKTKSIFLWISTCLGYKS